MRARCLLPGCLFLGDRGENLPGRYSLPVHAIQRIEVIRGPGSALYGAGARG